jgi:hypothetical protein
VFNIRSGVVSISALTIANWGGVSGAGGGGFGAAIYNEGTLSVVGSTF